MRWLSVVATLALLLGLLARELPPAWQPWSPLDVKHPPNLLTGWKLARATADPSACRAALATAGHPIARIPDRDSDIGCGLHNAVTLRGAVPFVPAGPVVTCPVALAWALFERHDLQAAARTELGTAVTGVRHLGSFVCRNVNHAADGRRSQHATANALDIAGFTLANGREVTLLQDWTSAGPEARFLRTLRDRACTWFRGVLGPDYNSLHRNHFHLDRGPWSTCR